MTDLGTTPSSPSTATATPHRRRTPWPSSKNSKRATSGRARPIALIALASGLEIGVVLLTLDEELVERYGHSH